MKKKHSTLSNKIFLLFFILLLLNIHKLFAQQAIWTGISNNQWTLASNWNPSVVPSTMSSVIIPNGTPNQPTLNTSNIIVDSITIQAGATFNLGTMGSIVNVTVLRVNGTLNFNTIVANTVNVAGDFSGTGTVIMGGAGIAHVLNLSGANNNIATLNTTGNTNSQIHYNGTVAQSVFVSPNYRILSIDNSSVKTLTGVGLCTVNQTFNVTAGATFSMGNSPTPPSLSTASAGSFATTINAGCTFDFGTVSPKTVTIGTAAGGNFTCNGTLNMAGI
ncbi:MAG TPA: hypothetical protein VNZ45_12030, partial [Bacteroidia bacterium]|nr:hypothetical protein [Bacteroidia bacterium]